MCLLWLTGKAARDQTLIISVKIEFLLVIPITVRRWELRSFLWSLERNSGCGPAENCKIKIRIKRFLPFCVTESSWPPPTLPCSHLQICKWRERSGAVCICIAHQKIRKCLCSHSFAEVLPFCCLFFFFFLTQLNITMWFICIFKMKESFSTWAILVSL